MSYYVLSLYLDFTSGKLEKISYKKSFFSYLIPDFILAPLDALNLYQSNYHGYVVVFYPHGGGVSLLVL